MGVIKPNGRRKFLAYLGAGVVVGAAAGFTAGRLLAPTAPPLAKELTEIIEQRKLELSHARAALKTYVPGGWKDEFVMISSGGHSGQVLVIGVPSMRLLKVIAVFTPEPWQGYGYGGVKTMKLLYKGSNGAGKTTLLRCMLGMLNFEGEVRVMGLDVRKEGKEVRRVTGYVPQNVRFPEDLTVYELVDFVSGVKGVDVEGPGLVSIPQLNLIVRAMELGYFDVPRRASIHEVARELGSSPASLSVSIRRGLKRVLKDYIAMQGYLA